MRVFTPIVLFMLLLNIAKAQRIPHSVLKPTTERYNIGIFSVLIKDNDFNPTNEHTFLTTSFNNAALWPMYNMKVCHIVWQPYTWQRYADSLNYATYKSIRPLPDGPYLASVGYRIVSDFRKEEPCNSLFYEDTLYDGTIPPTLNIILSQPCLPTKQYLLTYFDFTIDTTYMNKSIRLSYSENFPLNNCTPKTGIPDNLIVGTYKHIGDTLNQFPFQDTIHVSTPEVDK